MIHQIIIIIHMKTIDIISPVLDSKIQEHINESPIWHNAYHEEEITDEIYRKYNSWHMYSVKFEGLEPIQCTKISPYSKI